MRLTLHTAKIADWEKTAKGSHNIWQKVASKSYGTLTPANMASFAGGILGIYGLWVILDGHTFEGLILLAIGRVADLADGIIAEYTGTKSPLGETIDATVDKIVIAFALIVLGAIGSIPWIIIIVAGFYNAVNIIISVVARLRRKTIHPSRVGKIAAALIWVTIILYPFGDWLREDISDIGGRFLMLVSLVSFGIYAVIGLRATLSYGRAIYRVPARKLYSLFK